MRGVKTTLRDIARQKKTALRPGGKRRAPPAAPAAAAALDRQALDEAGPSLVVATYNVHACVGTDRRYDPARVAAVLRELAADIVSLQEVGTRRHGANLSDQAAFLAQATGLQIVAGPDRAFRRSRFGNAVLTRLPVLAVRYIDLSVKGCEPRGALDVDLDIGNWIAAGRALRVVATHFGLRGGERRAQTVRLLGAIAENGAADGDAILMMGDLNEWRGRRGGIRALDRELGRAPAPRTFPSWCPILPLDRIYAAPPALVRDVVVHRSPLARLASDHLPLRARLAWQNAA
jgi:endonuclease/exonuclease/phosphatase family metal-dependent hydrolase